MNNSGAFYLLSKKNLVELASSTHNLSSDILVALLTNLSHYGYTLSANVLKTLKTFSEEEVQTFENDLINHLKNITGDNVTYSTLYSHFPKETPVQPEHYINRVKSILMTQLQIKLEEHTVLSCGHVINHSIFDLSKFNACPVCENQVEELGNTKQSLNLPEIQKITPFKIIDLSQNNEMYTIFTNLIQSKSSLSEQDKEFVKDIITQDKNKVISHIPKEIPMKEQLTLVTVLLLEHTSISSKNLLPYFKTATDVLRLSAYFSGADVSLAQKFKIKLKNSQRNLILFLIDNLSYPLEDMNKKRSKFLALGEQLHATSKAKRFPNAANHFDILRNKPEEIFMFNSEVEKLKSIVLNVKQTEKGTIPKVKEDEEYVHLNNVSCSLMDTLDQNAIKKLESLKLNVQQEEVLGLNKNKKLSLNKGKSRQKALKELSSLLAKRAGEFLRNLDLLLRESTEHNEKHIIENFKSVVSDCTTPMLLNFSSFVNTRDKSSDLRFYIPKGSFAKIQFDKNDKRKIISTELINDVTKIIDIELVSRFKSKDNLGNVYLSEELRKCVVPLSQRNTTESINTLVRGSRVKLNTEANLIRFFLYWKYSCDLDLSLSFYNENLEQKDFVNYEFDNLQNDYAKHSGDIQSASKGAAECIDLDIDIAKSQGIRYALMYVNAYTGETFAELSSFVGIMERKDDNTGELFEPSTVTQKINLSGDSNDLVPLILDLETKEIIWTELTGGIVSAGSSISNSDDKFENMLKASLLLGKQKPNLFKLFDLHCQARATNVDYVFNEEVKYDLVLDIDKAFDIDDIVANWI
jgi:hypothetical protein